MFIPDNYYKKIKAIFFKDKKVLSLKEKIFLIFYKTIKIFDLSKKDTEDCSDEFYYRYKIFIRERYVIQLCINNKNFGNECCIYEISSPQNRIKIWTKKIIKLVIK